MKKSTLSVRPTAPITPAQFIRQHVLRMSAQDFAKALKVAGSIVSRYEKIPERHRARVDSLAKARGVKVLPEWHDRVPFDKTVGDL